RVVEIAKLAAAFRGTSEFALESAQQASAYNATLSHVWGDPLLRDVAKILEDRRPEPLRARIAPRRRLIRLSRITARSFAKRIRLEIPMRATRRPFLLLLCCLFFTSSYAFAQMPQLDALTNRLGTALEGAHTKAVIIADFSGDAGGVTLQEVLLADRLWIS